MSKNYTSRQHTAIELDTVYIATQIAKRSMYMSGHTDLELLPNLLSMLPVEAHRPLLYVARKHSLYLVTITLYVRSEVTNSPGYCADRSLL